MSLRKSDIIKIIASKAHIPNTVCNDVINSFIELIKSKSNKNDIKIANFGTFTNKITPERIGRNPKTGEEYIITERIKLNLIVDRVI